jgi:heme/copper-type cytochrome/quinol oxidase subunit 1
VTPPTIAPARPEVVSEGLRRRRPAWVERATSGDHKTVSLMFIAGGLSFLVLAALELALMRIQLFLPENTVIIPETFDRILSTFGATTIVLFAIPLALGLVGYLVPLQIGARGVAFPRVGLLSAWLYMAGAATLYGSYLYRPSSAGTLALPPLSSTTYSPTHGADARIVGVGLATLGFVLFAVNLLTTVRTMRAPGMAWRRVPIFSWAGTAISGVTLVTGSAMLAALFMLMIDRHFGGIFFDSQQGGAPLLYEHLSWLFYTGGYVTVVLLAVGAISEILPTLALKPLFSHRAATLSVAAIAVLGVLSWMQNMYSAPIPNGFRFFAMLMALGLMVPIGALIANWLATLWGGALRLNAASLYAVAAISTLSIGLLGELKLSVVPVGWQLANTATAQAYTAYVIVGGGVMGGFAALHYWMPKISGRLVGEGLGKVSLGAIFVGVHLFAIPMFLAGLKGQPVDIQKFYDGAGLNGFNVIASIGAFVLLIGIVIEVANIATSYRGGVAAGHDPWGGTTLEWFALSPPPPHNFDVVPDVRSAEPLLDIREAIADRADVWPRHATTPEPAPEPEPVAVAAETTPAEGPPETAAEHAPLDPAGTEPPPEEAPTTSPPDPASDVPPEDA